MPQPKQLLLTRKRQKSHAPELRLPRYLLRCASTRRAEQALGDRGSEHVASLGTGVRAKWAWVGAGIRGAAILSAYRDSGYPPPEFDLRNAMKDKTASSQVKPLAVDEFVVRRVRVGMSVQSKD